MSDKPTTKRSTRNSDVRKQRPDQTDWELLRSMSDEEASVRAARDPDAPPTDEVFWKTARVVWPQGKTKISLYIDNDVLTWFKKGGKGYQTRLNAVLRAYMNAQEGISSAS